MIQYDVLDCGALQRLQNHAHGSVVDAQLVKNPTLSLFFRLVAFLYRDLTCKS